MTLVERIDSLAARAKRLEETHLFIRDAKPGDQVNTDSGLLELSKPGTIESLRKEIDQAQKANSELMAERDKFIPNLQAALGEAKAKLDAIHRFAHHSVGVDGKATAAQPVTG